MQARPRPAAGSYGDDRVEENLRLQTRKCQGPEAAAGDDSQEPDFIESPLSQDVTRNGVSVRTEIYEDSNGGWILLVVDAESASHVWDERFETDLQALEEALRALDEETLDFWGGAADLPLS